MIISICTYDINNYFPVYMLNTLFLYVSHYLLVVIILNIYKYILNVIIFCAMCILLQCLREKKTLFYPINILLTYYENLATKN